MSLPQPLLAGEDAGQRGESWNKIIFSASISQCSEGGNINFSCSSHAHLCTPGKPGSKCNPWAPSITARGTAGRIKYVFLVPIKIHLLLGYSE